MPTPYLSPDGTDMAGEKVTLLALGDVWLARRVADEIAKRGAYHPFARIAQYLRSADIVFGNLESPFSTRGRPTKNKDVVVRSAPSSVEGLVRAGIDVVSLANNHIMDFGPEALQDTLSLLDENGIRHLGAGLTPAEARKPLRVTTKGIGISFHAYLCWGEASRAAQGPAGAIRSAMKEELERSRGQSDFVVVALHGGVEFQDYPTLEMIRLAHWVVDQGGDLVVGHHPHVIQGVEKYKNGLIAYSLGNFIFDSHDVELQGDRARQGLILKVDIHKRKSVQHQVIPIWINDQHQVEMVPEGDKKEGILRRLSQLSSPQMLSEKRGYSTVDQRAMVGKARDLLNRDPRFIACYVLRNFPRLLRRHLPALFRLGWQRLRTSMRGK
jgi:hypothetical protein